MAKLTFFGADGEQSFRLHPQRTLRIGRDPGNDVVLRDPKVSRHHAEVVFERGFFVLHDLDSSNGSFVNGRKIRVAPLIDGAELKLGNSLGKFTEDLPDQSSRSGSGDDVNTKPHERSHPSPADAPAVTTLEPKRGTGESKKSVSSGPWPQSRYHRLEYIFVSDSSRRIRSVRDAEERPLFRIETSRDGLEWIAATVLLLVGVAGVAAGGYLAAENLYLPALLAIALTVGFSMLIAALVPRRLASLFGTGSARDEVELMVAEETPFASPRKRFSAREADGRVIASFQKRPLDRLLRNRWWIVDEVGVRTLGYAVEEGHLLPFFRLFLRLFGALRSNFQIFVGGSPVGRFVHRDRSARRLDLNGDPAFLLDRRIALSLAMVLSTE
ncbi:MAG: FHA domain-containing protein [Thermoanaerobaculia bacterium]